MRRILKGRFFRHFLPFMLLIIGGSFFVREFTQIKYKYNKIESRSAREELIKCGLMKKKALTLEEEYEKLKQIDINNWENVRIPRPWEDPNNINN